MAGEAWQQEQNEKDNASFAYRKQRAEQKRRQ